jgi:septal ring factor EnvC (AmiA/AmiB activator)
MFNKPHYSHKPALESSTTVPVINFSSSSSPTSEFSNSLIKDEEIEAIKLKNNKTLRKIKDKLLLFKHTSSLLYNCPCCQTVPPSRCEGLIFAQGSPLTLSSDSKSNKSPAKKERNQVLKDIKYLKGKHQRVKSQLIMNIDKIKLVDDEIGELKQKLTELHEKIIIKCKQQENPKCCSIF